MGSRILPVFSGAPLRSPRLREIVFWLILAGMILFAWNVWPALSGTVRAKGEEPPGRRPLPVLRATAR
ncbi:MAG: hypothetical protein HY049_10320 [Acidobacteria bacterium]|nr:hypothetical protein [Acidobacteriota bacterium]